MKSINSAINKILQFRFAPQLLLLLLLIIGYWQVSTFHYALKYDMIDCYYPWRYMVGECLHNHILPLWNPYETLGYPIHADPQSGAWYPFVWIIGATWGYDIYSLEFEFLLHIFIAGTAMFYLGRTLKLTKGSSFMIAVAYMFSGLIIGNSQHFTWIISAAWIPYIISFYLKFTNSKRITDAIITGFYMYLLVSGGYPAFAVILCYFLIILFVFFSSGIIKRKEWKTFLQYIKLNFIFLISALLFSFVVLVSVYGVTSFITRGNKLPIEMALFNPLSPQCLISFVIPFAVIKDMSFFNTDLSMSNIYFGLVMFMFLIFSLFIKKSSLIKVFFWWGVFCLTAALGAYLPIRKILYDYFPMMGFFRFPSLFRLFTIISFLLTAGFAFDSYFSLSQKKKKNILIIIFSLIILSVASIIYSRMHGYLTMMSFVMKDLFIFSESSTIWQHIAFQSFVQMVFLSLIILVLLKVKDLFLRKRLIIIIACADLIFASWLNEPYTTYSQMFTTKSVKEISNTFPKGFPLPSSQAVVMNTDTGLSKGTFWKNMNIFHKQIAWDGFTPFKFKRYDNMIDSMPAMFRSMLYNSPVFLTDKVFPMDSLKRNNSLKKYNHKNIYLEKEDFDKLKSFNLKLNNGDTAFISSFRPDDISISVSCKDVVMLTLMQNFYTGWDVETDGNNSGMLINHCGLMGLEVPAGKHVVNFHYNNKKVEIAAIISGVSLLGFLIMMFVLAWKKCLKKEE